MNGPRVLFASHFPAASADLLGKLARVNDACGQVKGCGKLKQLLHLILVLGVALLADAVSSVLGGGEAGVALRPLRGAAAQGGEVS